jgi:hypothetical protein
MRTRFLTPLIMAIVLGLGVLGYLGVHAGLRAHHRSVYAAAEKQLQAIPLPAGVAVAGTTDTGGVRFGCSPEPATRCLHSEMRASAVGPLFDHMLHATSDDCRSSDGGIGGCRVVGRIAGRPAFLQVFPHAYVTRSGHIPAGAEGHFHNHLYFRGSDMVLGLVNP